MRSMHRTKLFYIFGISFVLFCKALSIGWAETEENESQAKKDKSEKQEPIGVGPQKGVLEANDKDGFTLSDQAFRTLGVQSKMIQSKQTHILPPKSLVYFQNEVGVYRLRKGWFKLIEGEVLNRSSSQVLFKSTGLIPGDQVVIEGAPLLRLTDLTIWSGSGDGDAD